MAIGLKNSPGVVPTHFMDIWFSPNCDAQIISWSLCRHRTEFGRVRRLSFNNHVLEEFCVYHKEQVDGTERPCVKKASYLGSSVTAHDPVPTRC